MQGNVLLRNCTLYDDPEQPPMNISIEDGVIKSIKEHVAENAGDTIIDVDGRLVTPGFIDLHIHGAGGVEVIRADEQRISEMSQALARMGTTGFLVTSVVVPRTIHDYLPPWVNAVNRDRGGAQILGIHLEGPFVNPQKLGGMQDDWHSKPSRQALQELLELTNGTLKMMTIAPEVSPDFPIIQVLLEADVVPALGHTNATYQQTRQYLDAGITHITHLYNAMPSLHHREPGPLLAIFESDQVTAQLICDGRHVSPDILRWTYRQLGPDRCICITDGMEAVGQPEGRYLYNGVEYEVKNGTAYYLNGTLIGTALPLAQMALNFHRYTDCTLKTAIHAGTLNPARVLGIEEKKGTLEPGKDADIVVFDRDDSVWATLVSGSVVYQK